MVAIAVGLVFAKVSTLKKNQVQLGFFESPYDLWSIRAEPLAWISMSKDLIENLRGSGLNSLIIGLLAVVILENVGEIDTEARAGCCSQCSDDTARR